MPKQDFGCLHAKTDGLRWQKGRCPGLSSLRCAAGSWGTVANLSSALCCLAWQVLRHPLSIPSPCEPRDHSACDAALPPTRSTSLIHPGREHSPKP